MILVRHGQSEFNVVFGATRQDPGIIDAPLTKLGWQQAEAAGARLASAGVARLIVSPYTRTLQTASAILKHIDVPVTIDTRVGERAWFSCDIGTPRSKLAAAWADHVFDHLEEEWWPIKEAEHRLDARVEQFRQEIAQSADWSRVCVVTHWGVIRSLTGVQVGNCEAVTFDPRRARAVTPMLPWPLGPE